MNTWLRHHGHALGRAWRRVGLLNVLVIGVALALPAGGYALIESLRTVSGRLALDPQISVFLDAKRADAESVGAALRRDGRISRVRFVPRDQALKELGSVQGLSDLVAALGRNPLPDVFVVTAREESIEPLAADLAKLPGVAHVQADALWARRLGSMARVARLGVWLLAGLLGVALVAVTFNTIRLQILTQRDEIEVSKLIGATDAFIRRPFFYLGALQGLAGGLVALAILWGSLAALNVGVAELAASYGSSFRLAFLAPGDALAIALFSAGLGWFGAYMSVSRYLLEIEPK